MAATAALDSSNGSVNVAQEQEDDQSTASANPYGRRYFPLAAVVGQVSTAAFPHSVCVCELCNDVVLF